MQNKPEGDKKLPQQENKKKKYRRIAADIEKQFEVNLINQSSVHTRDAADLMDLMSVSTFISRSNMEEATKQNAKNQQYCFIFSLKKQIILNSQTGNNLPQVDINFPPNYLNVFTWCMIAAIPRIDQFLVESKRKSVEGNQY